MTGKKIIFAGPSLQKDTFESSKEVTILPPCKQGDIYLAALGKPCVIGVIDGFFEGVPSVWHKEILWAMSNGITVVGAASMGALRACELDHYGMVGIGKIYEDYRDKNLDDDDEVALLHGPSEMDFIPLSLAMVNARQTILWAMKKNVIGESMAKQITSCAKDIFYKERTWETVFKNATQAGGQSEQLANFQNWVNENEVDQKMLDALELIRFIEDRSFADPFVSEFEFEVTEFWHQTTRRWQSQSRQKQSEIREEDTCEGYKLFS